MGPKADEDRIPGIDVALADGDTWDFGGLTMHVMDTPGHTRGHITLWFPEADALFPGAHGRHTSWRGLSRGDSCADGRLQGLSSDAGVWDTKEDYHLAQILELAENCRVHVVQQLDLTPSGESCLSSWGPTR